MKKILFVTFAALVMSAMVVSCGDNVGSGSNKSDNDSASATNGRGGDSTTVSENITDPNDSLINDTTGIDPDKGMSTTTFIKAQRKALLIGISSYKDNSWGKINSGNDISLLKNTLSNELGFEVAVCTEGKATHQGIINALENLIKKCHPGDTVMVHFSGHGQQMVDMEGDEADGRTEAFIAYDAEKTCSAEPNGYRGKNHFKDDEMHKYITKLRKQLGKDGYLLVTIDACHSGGSSRAASGSSGKVVRGTNEIFGYGILEPANKKGRTVAGTVGNANYMAISACQPNEKNYEVFRNGKNYGSLSFILNEKLLNVKSGKLTLDQLGTAIKGESSYWSNQGQTPFIDNNDENVQ